MEQTVAKVYRTDNYSLFKFLDGNRNIDPARVNKVTKSIEEVGYILSPLVVNERMEIIDGQARYTALKNMRLPVDYVVARGAGVKECVALNRYSSAWTVQDYIKSYADLGFVPYLYLEQMVKAYVKTGLYPIHTVYLAIKGKERGGGADDVTTGNFECTREQYDAATRTLEDLKPIRKIVNNLPNKRYTWSAILWMTKQEDVDNEKLISCIEKRQGDLRPAVSTEDAIGVLNEMYNFGNRRKLFGLDARYREEKNASNNGLYSANKHRRLK